jgi:hypothetical protein
VKVANLNDDVVMITAVAAVKFKLEGDVIPGIPAVFV